MDKEFLESPAHAATKRLDMSMIRMPRRKRVNRFSRLFTSWETGSYRT
jgi:hypothetical protein